MEPLLGQLLRQHITRKCSLAVRLRNDEIRMSRCFSQLLCHFIVFLVLETSKDNQNLFIFDFFSVILLQRSNSGPNSVRIVSAVDDDRRVFLFEEIQIFP